MGCTDMIIGTCEYSKFTADGFCDDGNNNAFCGWDGGDCCGSSGKKKQYNYCGDCLCLDCTVEVVGDDCVDAATGSCQYAAYTGDGYCDDGNNNAGCGWDGGDCCGSSGINQQFSWCNDCSCQDCTFAASGDECVDAATGSCQAAAYAGDGFCDDGFCDDENNSCTCGWDSGDCCGDNVKTAYCS